MFARSVSVLLKPDTLGEFTQTLENEILPIMRQQPGFRDNIVLAFGDSYAGSGGTEVTEISLWDSKQEAETFLSAAYPKVLEILAPFLDGVPETRVSTVINSTSHSRYERPPQLWTEPVMLDPSRPPKLPGALA